MSDSIFPPAQIAGALSLLTPPDPRVEVTASLQVLGGAEEADARPRSRDNRLITRSIVEQALNFKLPD